MMNKVNSDIINKSGFLKINQWAHIKNTSKNVADSRKMPNFSMLFLLLIFIFFLKKPGRKNTNCKVVKP